MNCPTCNEPLLLTPSGYIVCIRNCVPARFPTSRDEEKQMLAEGRGIEKPKNQLRTFGAAMKEFHEMFGGCDEA